MMPALLTSTSTPPNAACMASNIPRTACASLTSALAVSARPPLSSRLAADRAPLRNRKFARLSVGGTWIRNFRTAALGRGHHYSEGGK
jgi:hypothetical protein